MVKIKAPAKINLTLEALGKRPDDYHEIRSVIQAIDLYDTLYIEAGRGFTFECDLPGWSAGKSLVSKVLSLLPLDSKAGAAIKLEKRIPLLSGLGGDSSDAAAMLKGLNEFYKFNLSNEKLQEIAAQLGSDAAFFLQGGTALAEGRGEILKPLPPPTKTWLVVIVPNITVEPGKTTRMYAALKTSHFTNGVMTTNLVETLKRDGTLRSELLYNVFEDIVFDMYPKLSYYISGLIRLGVPVHLTGSGPTLFALFQDKAMAEDLCKKCKAHKATAYVAATLGKT
jgi:4-diphosphocytidyl-2-C-methyl-D-erythritol kinase